MSLKITEDEWASVLVAYQRGLQADMIQFQNAKGEWGVVWTVPPCSPIALEKAGRQAIRCRTVRIRHIRRASLTAQHRDAIDVVIVTEAAPMKQEVRCLKTSRIMTVGKILADRDLQALIASVVDRSEDVP